MKLFVWVCAIIALGAILLTGVIAQIKPKPLVQDQSAPPQKTAVLLWPYTCVDTMKTSRDTARRWAKRPDLEEIIARQMSAIRESGANCVAISTPYDAEFINYLEAHVRQARAHNLHVWFRGNFSQWENWFDYPGTMNETELFTAGTTFVASHSALFADGDIFTLAPEGENGGPFDQVEIDEYPRFRKFLIDEYTWCQNSFKKINKNVVCNWLSMNGGLAKRMLDQSTIDALGKVVTLDHYIKTAPEMGEFIDYFKNKFGAQVVIGEFGAPIPEINGAMSEIEQAHFTDLLFKQMYERRQSLNGINYWVLYDGSTRMLNDDYSPRAVYSVVQKYYAGGVRINGVVENSLGEVLSGVKVFSDDTLIAQTNSHGEFSYVTLAGSHSLRFELEGYKEKTISFESEGQSERFYTMILVPRSITPEYRFQEWFRRVR